MCTYSGMHTTGNAKINVGDRRNHVTQRLTRTKYVDIPITMKDEVYEINMSHNQTRISTKHDVQNSDRHMYRKE